MKENKLSKLKLAQKRNYFKFIISGMLKPIDLDCLTKGELEMWNNISSQVNLLKQGFDNNSRQLGLNVPEHRCWCGKPAKLQVDYYGNGYLVWLCNKHEKQLKINKI